MRRTSHQVCDLWSQKSKANIPKYHIDLIVDSGMFVVYFQCCIYFSHKSEHNPTQKLSRLVCVCVYFQVEHERLHDDPQVIVSGSWQINNCRLYVLTSDGDLGFAV